MPVDKEGDVQFTFSAEEFMNAVKQMSSALSSLEKNSDHFSKNVEKGVGKAMLKFSILWEGLKKGFGAITGAINKNIPELGQAFKISGDIIMRNLLWPLRKTLMPMLQQMLNWVVKNRKMFAQWGAVLVTMFNGLKKIFQAILTFMDPVFKAIRGFLTKMVGTGSLTEQLNLFIFKATVAVMAFLQSISPLSKTIGEIVGAVGDLAKALIDLATSPGGLIFWDALVKDLNIVLTTLKIVVDLITGLLTMNFSKFLENFSKEKVTKGLETNLGIYDDEPVRKAVMDKPSAKSWQALVDFDRKAFNATKDQKWETAAALNLMYAKKDGFKEVHDAIITKDGKVIKTDPQDNIIATKGGGSKVNVNFGNTYVTVTEGNARAAGENFIGGIENKLRNILMDRSVTSGGH